MAEDAQMKLRLPKALKQQIDAAALENNRSLNGEIVSRLEASFPNYTPDTVSVRRGPRHETIETRVAALERQIETLLSKLGIEQEAEPTLSEPASLRLLKNAMKDE